MERFRDKNTKVEDLTAEEIKAWIAEYHRIREAFLKLNDDSAIDGCTGMNHYEVHLYSGIQIIADKFGKKLKYEMFHAKTKNDKEAGQFYFTISGIADKPLKVLQVARDKKIK